MSALLLSLLRRSTRLLMAVLSLCLLDPLHSETVTFGVIEDEYWRSTTWLPTDGLPSLSVAAVAAGPDGCLWVGTTRGLVRFNGKEFIRPPKVLAGPRQVIDLLWDKRGRLWILRGLSHGDIERWDPADESFIHYEPVEEPKHPGQHIPMLQLYEDKAGRMYVSSYRGLLEVTTLGLRVLDPSILTAPNFPGRSVLRQSPDGRLWVATYSGVAELVEGKLVIPGPRGISLWDIAFGPDGSRWELPQKGAYPVLRRQGEKVTEFPWPEPMGWTREMLLTRQGDLWALSDEQGAMRVSAGSDKASYITCSSGLLPTDRLHTITEDREGSLWLATADKGLCQLSRVAAHTYTARDCRAMPGGRIEAVAADREGCIWASFATSGLVKTDASGQLKRLTAYHDITATTLARARDGGMWAASTEPLGRGPALLHLDGTGRVIRPIPGLMCNTITHQIFEDSTGGLWMHCVGAGNWRQRAPGQPFEKLPGPLSPVRQHPTLFTELRPGELWMSTGAVARPATVVPVGQPLPATLATLKGTEGLAAASRAPDGGLWGIQGQSKLWHLPADGSPARVLGAEQGVPEGRLLQLIVDGQSRLWLQSQPEGIAMASTKELSAVSSGSKPFASFTHLGLLDGVSSGPIDQSSASSALDAQGRVWFAGDQALIVLEPDRVLKPGTVFHARVDRLTADGVAHDFFPFQEPPKLSLAPGTRSLRVSFSSGSLAAPERARYRHRLVGLRESWSEESSQPEAEYIMPPTGHYRFEVIARAQGGIWQAEATSLRFIIQPSFWQTPLFKLSCALAAVMLLSLALHYLSLRKRYARIANEQRVQAERSRIARDLHDHVGASINGILLAVATHRRDSELEPAVIARFAQVERLLESTAMRMDEAVWLTNPKNDTLRAFTNYIIEYAQEYCDHTHLECICELPAELPEKRLPGWQRVHLLGILKEALSNIAQHAQATEVELHVVLSSSSLGIIIQDNGQPAGKPSAPQELGGNGLRNMHERAAEMGASLCVETHDEPHGTRVTLRLPFAAMSESPGKRSGKWS